MSERTLQEEFLSELATHILSGNIIVHDDDSPWFELLRQRYPLLLNGVDWDKVPGAESEFSVVPVVPPEGISGEVPVQHGAGSIRAFLGRFAKNAAIGDRDKCIVLGDGVTDVALEMAFATLIETFVVLFSYPQATYVITPDASWCFVFTFECYLYFGKAPYRAGGSLSPSNC